MWTNYIISAWRNLIKNGMFSLINVFGLALGLMSCLLIMLFVQDELGYESTIPDADKIVRLHTAYEAPGRVPFLTLRSAGRMMEAIKGYAPEQVEEGMRMVTIGFTVQKGSEAFAERVNYADSSFFKIFDLPFIEGNGLTSFADKNAMVITEEMALKYFGKTDVVGETLTFNSASIPPQPYKITGVLKSLPDNSHMTFNFLVHMDPAMFDPFPNMLNTWTSVNTYTYFKLKDGASVADLQERVYSFINNESIFKNRAAQMGDDVKATDAVKHRVMPIKDIHLYAKPYAGSMGGMKPLGDAQLVYTFSIVAGLVLVIACINFMNLATARATGRAREVALRKVMGASRVQVALQFLGEAVMVSFISLLFALVAVEVALPAYNEVLGRNLTLDLMANPNVLTGLLSLTLLVGLIAGSYPALYLSGFLPAKILKANNSAETKGSSRFRFVLVLFQFAISIGLVVSTAVVYGQTLYVLSKDPGYNSDQKLVIAGRELDASQKESMATALSKINGVNAAVWSSEVPTQDFENNTFFTLMNAGKSSGDGAGNAQGRVINYHNMGFGFFEAYDVKPLEGRLFDRQYGTDAIKRLPQGSKETGKSTIILNESAVTALGIKSPKEAIGQYLKANVFRGGAYEMEIIGVIPDLYYRSLKFGVRSSVYMNNPAAYRNLTIAHNRSDVSALKNEISALWKSQVPMKPLSIQHLDAMIEAQYASEAAQGKIFAAFAILAIVIACLGLYGLASYTAERRTKEIGIRKVLGAGIIDIIRLLVWQFSKPVIMGGLIAAPVAFYYMTQWLMTFEYRLGQDFVGLMIAISAIVALVISWLTVAGRAYRVARQNPIKSLRYE